MTVVVSFISGLVSLIGAVWYLSGRLSRQDAMLEHLHDCIEHVKEDVKELRDTRGRIGFYH